MSETRARLAQLSPEKRALLMQRLKERRGDAGDVTDVWPAAPHDPAQRHEPFALTPLQQAYWVGRDASFDMGQVATHSYMELEADDLDLERVESTFNRLIERHPMLRARFLEDGRQQILETVDPYRVEVDALDAAPASERDARLSEVRQRMSHSVHDPGVWPLFELRAARLPEGRTRLFFGVDALIVDAWSVKILFEEWAALYEDPEADLASLELTFRDYVGGLEALSETPAYERAAEYWRERAETLPSQPALPMATTPDALVETTFVRRTATLDAERWASLQARAGQTGMTATAITLAAYADVLSLWAETPRFTLSVPQFNRHPLHDEVDRVVGEFASFSLLEVDNRGDDAFAERAKRHQHRLWEDLDHAVFDGVGVLRELARRAPGDAAPMMPVVFTSAPQGGDGGGVGDALPETLWDVVYVNNQSSQVWLDNHLSERDGALVCDWDTVDDLFPPGLPEDMLAAFMTHLERLADDDDWWQRTWMDVAAELLPAHHVEVSEQAGGPELAIPDERIQEAFFRRVATAPDALAVVTPERRMSYGELADRVAACRERLIEADVSAGDRVAIVMEKGWEQVVAAYACLEAGAAYLPLDASDPPARRARLLERAGASVVLLQPHLDAQGGWPEGTHRVPVEWPEGDEPKAPRDRAAVPPAPDEVAFVLYTSGSTGEPKAVQIAHRGVVNALRATEATFALDEHDRVLGLTALHHDMSVFDTFGVLGAGGTLVLPSADRRRDPAHWAELMSSEGVTVWNSVPAMMVMLLAYQEDRDTPLTDTLRLAFMGGDWIPVTLPARLRALIPDVELVSVGGPTETTLWNIWHRIGEVDPELPSIPYGKPIANTRYHVVSEDGVERPLWVPGVLHVNGVGVTLGYLDDADATAAKRGTLTRTGESIWSTGDVGRRRPDGSIEFLGRSDLQVQLRGHRVELGEVEAHVTRFDGVEAAAVSAVEDPRGGLQLAAYVVWDGAAAVEALNDHLSERLPPHMVPTAVVTLPELPLTRNGKVDRSALPAPDTAEAPAAPAGEGVEASETESIVLDLIEDALGTRVEPTANLLEYGANSIDMVRIGNRLEERFGSRPPIDEIFRLQTARALASYYASAEAAASADPTDPIAARLASYRVALSPDEREAFKAKRSGLRADLSGRAMVDLELPLPEPELDAALWERRSHRRFGLEPLAGAKFGGLLSGMSERAIHDKAKRLYGTPGGLYPTQVYVHVKPGRIEGVPGGTYYYDPVEHRLVTLSEGAEIPRDIHVPFVNAPVFDEAAFSIFFVVQLDAIGPSYGERSLHFATLEAGVMAATLEAWAPRWDVGLCQMGDIDFESIRPLFDLDEGHVFIHSMVGGPSVGEGPESREIGHAGGGSAEDRLLERIKGLSPEEIQAMLDARQRDDG